MTKDDVFPFTAMRASWDYRVPRPYSADDRVFEIQNVFCDPRFAPLSLGEALQETRELFAAAAESPSAMAKLRRTWIPPRVSGRCGVWNDCPTTNAAPTFSRRAVDALRDLLAPCGTLFPFKSHGRPYWFFVAATVDRALDVRNSSVRRSHVRNGRRTSIIDYYHFDLKRLGGASVFRIRQQPFDTFVTDAFVQRVKERGLLGFDFNILFPLRTADVRKFLAFRAERRHMAEGYPPGQSLNGKRVTVRFKVDNPDRCPTTRQERQIKSWAKRVNDELFDIDSTDAPMGYLSRAYMDTGAMTCTFCGPQAAAILARVRPLLPAAKWPGKVVITPSLR